MAVGFPNQGFAKYPDPATEVVDKIFKEFYLPAVRDLLNSKRILSRFLRRNSEDVAGEKAVIALNIGRNEGIGFVDEQGKLPDPGKQQYERATYRMRYNYGRILFTGPAVASSRNDRGAFIRIMDGEIRGVARDLQHENNRVMFGDGSGVLAVVTGTSGSSVLINNPGGFTNPGPGPQYIRPGMRVGFLAGGTTLRAATTSGDFGFRVLSVDPSTNAITVDGGAGTAELNNAAAGDEIVRVSENAIGSTELISTSFENEPWGLAAAIDEGNPGTTDLYGALDADVEGIWNAAVVDNAGVPILFTQDMLQQAEDNLDIIGDGVVQMWMTTHGIRRQYLNELVSNKRYVNTMKLDGGWTALEYSGRPLVVDKDCTRGRIYGLDLETLYLFVETDYQWMDADGSILHRLPNFDAYQATLYRYWQLGGDARNRNVVIKDLIDS